MLESKKIIKRYLSQKVVDQKVFNGFGGAPGTCATWRDSVVEYTDGTTATVRECTTEMLRESIVMPGNSKELT